MISLLSEVNVAVIIYAIFKTKAIAQQVFRLYDIVFINEE